MNLLNNVASYPDPTTGLFMKILLWVLVGIIVLIVDAVVISASIKVADQKGYDPLVGVLLGIFVNIVGLLAILFLPKKSINSFQQIENKNNLVNSFFDKVGTKSYHEQNNFWVCPRCGQKNNATTKNCSRCLTPRN